MSFNCIFKRKNVDKVQRNGETPESKTIIKYVTQTGTNGVNGEDSYHVVLSPNNKTFTAGSYNANNQTYYINVYAYRGNTQINAYVFDSSIVGKVKDAFDAYALDASVVPGTNGTDHTQICVAVTEELSADAGELKIPVQYNVDSTDASSNMIDSEWDPETNSLATVDAIFSWTLGKTGESAYTLNLSNERASINVDVDGVPYPGAVRPPCVAKLAFGANDNLTGVYYDASCTPAAQGFTINHTTGEFLYDHDAHAYDSKIPDASFNFGDASTNTVLNIRVDASYDGRVQARKTMIIEKALPGQQGPQGETGEPATSRWIGLSADIVKIDASNNIIPSTITATKYKQIGGNTPIVDTSANINIKWFHDSSAEQLYTTPVEVSTTWNNITFKLYDGSTFIGETETVPIIKDGKNGQNGQQGQRGAAIRGPVLWDSSTDAETSGLSPRWFYCGVLGDDGRADANKYIDVIIHDGQYYVCNTNYHQDSSFESWDNVLMNWTEADASFNFVAANLILAQNAGIDFLTGNEIYLKDSDGHVTAGAAGGNGISFWAGGPKDASANFVVNYDGTMTAKKGQFGCLSIGTDSAGASVLTGEGQSRLDDTSTHLTLAPTYLEMDASTTLVRIAPGGHPDSNATIHIDSSVNDIDMWADGIVKSGNLETMTTIAPGNVTQSGTAFNSRASGGGAVITPGLFNIEVVFIASSASLFSKAGDTWTFNGIDTRVPTASYPNLRLFNNPGGFGHGYWSFVNSANTQYILSGIAGSSVERLPNVIYITL